MAKRKSVVDNADSAQLRRAKKNGSDSRAKVPLEGIHRPLPLVAQVERALRIAIERREFPGGRLPILVKLAEQFGVSCETVRMAVKTLRSEGLIINRGRGKTFVNALRVPQELETPPPRVLGYILEEYDCGGSDAGAVSKSYNNAMLEGAIIESGRHDYRLIATSAKPLLLRESFDKINSLGPLQGVVFACVAEEKLLKGLSGRDLPTVLLDHEMHLPNIVSVRGDSEQNAILAVNHLASLGHRNIACVHWLQHDLNPWFLQGYHKGMRKEHLRRHKKWEIFIELNEKGAQEALDQLMALPRPPTAIICFDNAFAGQLITAAGEKGFRIPEDISVIGGGGDEVINLTYTHLDYHHLGSLAIRRLLKAIDSKTSQEAERVLVPYKLKPGQTTAPIASEG